MRAVRFHEFGPADVLGVEEVPDPVAGPGQVLVRVTAIGVNYGETIIRSGTGARVVPWYDLAPGALGGEVVGVGPDGRRLIGFALGEGYAELALLPEDATEVPDDLSDHEALALYLQGATAVAAADAVRLAAGERVLVEAAAGGVGSLLVQVAARAGATVVAAARGERKLALARELGAHEVVDYGEPDWPTWVEPVDVVFSSVGGAVARQSFELLRDGVGRLAVFGFASGEPLDVTASDVFRKGVAVLGFGNPVTPDAVRRAFTSGLRPVLGEALPLADAARAHELLETRASTGKVVLVP
ncbi:quinone oxidoreductase family protein [Saccharothrix luteola]|uniref:quinone oxidoreductase family protein n=1 Tax=Saccharothrix luteola TaxID=2893018 RepID=UPI001E5EA23E|nr:zinc-binding dehydrogenase [Saccharothrix luteola]MCC8248612.1 zinc-binding dehydrogenase [Saccharothrix luteola]